LPFKSRLLLLARRFGALAYDLLLLLGLAFVAALPVVVARGDAIAAGDLPLQLWLLFVCGGYVLYAMVRRGATLGMLAWRLELETLGGQRPGVVRAMLWLTLAGLGGALAGVGWWWLLFDPAGRTLHDRWSGMQVVHRPRSANPAGGT
jgi:uncharacterized RDD family membrane protein YckC